MISCDNNERLDFQILGHLIAILVSVGNAEGRVDPAVGVHHVLGHIGVNDAVNGVTLRHNGIVSIKLSAPNISILFQTCSSSHLYTAWR